MSEQKGESGRYTNADGPIPDEEETGLPAEMPDVRLGDPGAEAEDQAGGDTEDEEDARDPRLDVPPEQRVTY